MPVILKSQVVDSLRAARNADDELSRLKESSWENYRSHLTSLVESSGWKHGPAELLATFDHHLVAKSPSGDLVQVEWSKDKEGNFKLGRATVHETAVPVADLGAELMETAKAAVDAILQEDYDDAENMIATIAEALDAGGDLQRRVVNEVTVRSLTRDAWWHTIVGQHDGVEDQIPSPQTEGDDAVARSSNDLLFFLKEAAGEISNLLKSLANSEVAKDLESVARDIAEDTQRAVSALAGVDSSRQDEALSIYEAVVTATPRLLNGLEFLRELNQSTSTEIGLKGQEITT